MNVVKTRLSVLLLLAAFAFPSSRTFAQGYTPAEAIKKMKVADGFEVQVIASEPMIAQPVCIEFDDRGRLWVIQYLQYPNPAGLTRVKVDRYSRTIYDKVPEPPPRGPKGADRITILEPDQSAADILSAGEKGKNPDSPSAGKMPAARYRAKDFVSGLNLTTGLAFGHGGVFVLQVPYLLFYPDKNRDDVPDGDPEVCLTGFGMEDAHSVANSLTWGPDGWLYGCQGSTVTANIRGIEFQQGMWRYHPVTKRFELFCEGGGNSWGADFDEDGNLIYATNFGGYRGLHGVQGGYYWKSFGKHGALHNPYAYGYFDHMPHDRFLGGHVSVGGMIYQNDSSPWPDKLYGSYIHVDTLGHAVWWNKIERFGSSFQTKQGEALIEANDTWFAPTDLTIGPDGAIYFSDWYDKRTAHPDPDADWDRSNGRIYRLQVKDSDDSFPAEMDLRKLSSSVAVKMALSGKNDWWARKARRVLADRRDPKVYPELRAEVFQNKSEAIALQALWALYVSGGADESFLNDCLDHSSANIRKWAVRFLGDEEKISPTSIEHLLKVAQNESDIMVRSQLACTAKRLPAMRGAVIASTLSRRDLDAKDPHIPLLLWWAVEKHSIEALNAIMELFASEEAWKSTITRETILPRLIRRYAAEASYNTLAACPLLIESAPENERTRMLASMEQGFREQSNDKRISEFTKLPENLRSLLTSLWKPETTDQTLIRLLNRVGFAPARERALALATDKNTAADLRVAMVQFLAEAGNHTATFLKLVSSEQPESIKLAALDALQQSDSADISTALLNEYPRMNERIRSKTRDVLLGRKPSALALLQQVDAGKISSKEIPVEQVRQVSLHQDKPLDDLVRKFWGNVSSGTPEEKLADIRRFNNDLRAAAGDAKNGREVYLKTCAVCHELFGEGQKVGPELTHANRHDKDFMLASIVDPSAVIRKEYLNYNIELNDGRVLSGLIAEQSGNSMTVVIANNERTTVDATKVVGMEESAISLMPEGLMHALTPEERRDLFAYLQSEKPPEIKKPSAKNEMERIKVNGRKFAGATSGKEFTPIGFNYDRDYKMRLLEDYWNSEWDTVADDFQEMKNLGANVVRIHLQFAKFMDAPDKPNDQALQQLSRLLVLAEETGLYLDITGLGCYRKADVPTWYEALAENERWSAQAKFWEAVAATCAKSPAVFCYDLMNEPIIPGDQFKEWLAGYLGGFYYIQAVTLDSAKRSRSEIARLWMSRLAAAIRQHDKQTPITIGLLPIESPEVIQEVASICDFISVHIYPKSGKLDEDLKTLKKFSVGKPLIIEETFPMHCGSAELREFIKRSSPDAVGWISFYWGQTPEQLRGVTNISAAITRDWLEVFQQIQPAITQVSTSR